MSDRQQQLFENLKAVEERISAACKQAHRERSEINLITVTKTYPVSDVQILFGLGVRDFGENRDDEGAQKSQLVTAHWHFQGQVQSKKLRSIASWAKTIHSIDSLEHLEKLSRTLQDSGNVVEVFLQLSLDGDPSRGGAEINELLAMAAATTVMTEIKLAGLMCVPPAQWEHERAFSEIAQKAAVFTREFPDSAAISAGMSGDFETAIKYGATHIRVGSQILGSRTYPQ
jgi:pyridoxal phosphate enzyme (YggS family)